ncbi:nucleotidyltransferase family protein [Telmatocola sphagniphila]|uniref:Nucleotidyltransferase family protein n=1 Tax=Telmatocola sphagniphila TaxID=1123043 RepID=A0A8E6ESD1_9BACT|nr:nucleotidyltransferase family protein [Telmatocola sphagniphila]QVL30544.1 nucleotidyltransferase family protein [Telmatocola sphagniphila]
MDAIILAAGFGTRLRPHTEKTPKPLLAVQGRPILDWIIGALPPVDRLVVVVNYLAEQVEDYLKQQQHVKNWVTVRQPVPRGTGDALMSCKKEIGSDRLLVLNGDDLYGVEDLSKLASKSAGIMTYPVDEPKKFGIVFPRADGTLANLIEKPNLEGRHLANIGAYLFPRSVFNIELPLSPRGEYEITDAVSTLAAQAPFHIVEAKFWLPIGTIEAWQGAQTADVSPARKS